MTGIDRLRNLAGAWDAWGLGSTLAEIADEIERERTEDCYRMGFDCGTVWRVVADMERHCLGHEGMEDSPVARWARELRGALKSDTSDGPEAQKPSWHDHAETADVTSDAQKVTRDPAKDVSMSVYDLLPADEREAIAWVREHGGIEAVKEEWNHSRNLKRSLETAQAKVERQQRHIEFVQGKCRERQGHIVELTKKVADMRPRLMPEGCEWPRFEDGEPVRIGDEISWRDEGGVVNSIELQDGGYYVLHAADGAEDWIHPQYFPGERIKRPAVLAADGEPLEVGQTVWDTNGDELVIGAFENGGHTVTCRYADVGDSIPTHGMWSPSDLTHQRPDTWQRIAEDATLSPEVYCHRNGIDTSQKDGTEIFLADTVEPMASDLVRRCRALAERERGE